MAKAKGRKWFVAEEGWKKVLPPQLVVDILCAQGYTKRAALAEVLRHQPM